MEGFTSQCPLITSNNLVFVSTKICIQRNIKRIIFRDTTKKLIYKDIDYIIDTETLQNSNLRIAAVPDTITPAIAFANTEFNFTLNSLGYTSFL